MGRGTDVRIIHRELFMLLERVLDCCNFRESRKFDYISIYQDISKIANRLLNFEKNFFFLAPTEVLGVAILVLLQY